MEPLISVIVPVYNVESYLDKCIESIISQKYQNIEVLLIDDGSFDSSSIICDKWAKNDKRIKVTHKKNAGISSARNTGIRQANGIYLAFVDGDDKLNSNIYTTMVDCATKHNTDLVMCGYETFPNGNIFIPNVIKNKVINSNDFISSSKTIHSDNDLCYSWRFLIKKEIIDNNRIFFDENIKIGEDFLFNLEIIMNSKSLYVLPEALYNYRIDNEYSIMRTKYKPYLEEQLQLQYEKKKSLSIKYNLMNIDSWRENMSYYYITNFLKLLFTNALNGPSSSHKAAIKRILRLPLIRENLIYLIKNNSLFLYGFKTSLFYLSCYLKLNEIVYCFVKKYYIK